MNSKFSQQVFVAKDAARAATQIYSSTTGGYAALGEVVLVDQTGAVVEAAAITAKSQVLSVVMRSNDDKIYKSTAINGANVKSAYVKKYCAAVQQFAKFTVSSADALKTNFNFVVRVRDWKPRESYFGRWKTADFAVTTAKTVAQIAEGIARSINANFVSDRNFPVCAASNASGDVILMGIAPYYEAGKFNYEHFRYVVEPVNFDSSVTVSTNLGTTLAIPALAAYNPYTIPASTTQNPATIGDGTVNDIKDLEWFYLNNFYATKLGRRINVPYEYNNLQLNVEASKCYDKVIINLEYGMEEASNAYSTTLPSSIVLCLPTGANQGDDLIAGINKYLYTLWGVIPAALTLT